MTQFTHYGLFFTEAHLQRAQKSHDKAPFAEMWKYVYEKGMSEITNEWLMYALRFRMGDEKIGKETFRLLNQLLNGTDKPITNQGTTGEIVWLGQLAELLRPLDINGDLIDLLKKRIDPILKKQPNTIDEQIWQGVVALVLGVISENNDMIQNGIHIYKDTIDNHIHPEGYLPLVVETSDERTGLENQLRCAKALVLIAEMAKHIGIDLYDYNKRGVSVLTACAYPLYYYFYPEKWRWSGDKYRPSEGIQQPYEQGIFRRNSAFLEIIAEHYKPPLKAIQMILDDLRPMLDPFGGGLTTLTHAPAPRRGLFG